jgi:predicted AAA+ superfamily ATPase
MEQLYEISRKLIRNTDNAFKRSLYSKIDFNQRLTEITGSRGVGKTTLMLQKAKELAQNSPRSVMYISLDDAYFFNHSIIDTADEFQKYGGKYLFADEVHKYIPKHKNFDWSAELKNIYDRYPDLKVIYSGSSIIELYKGLGDLSRRKNTYRLNGLSFREYLQYNNILDISPIALPDILSSHLEITESIVQKIKVLPHFKSYLKNGYYPFYNENPKQYTERIKSVINLILETDIPAAADINYAGIGKIKTMLSVLASAAPYTPNLSKLSANIEIADTRTLYKYLYYLEKAELISLLKSAAKANKKFHKPEKIYLNNPNLFAVLSPEKTETGTLRESFFMNQVGHLHSLNYPKSADFKADDKYTFEIGGKNKTKKQIRGTENAFIAKDDIETGHANSIPLWIFGFLY